VTVLGRAQGSGALGRHLRCTVEKPTRSLVTVVEISTKVGESLHVTRPDEDRRVVLFYARWWILYPDNAPMAPHPTMAAKHTLTCLTRSMPVFVTLVKYRSKRLACVVESFAHRVLVTLSTLAVFKPRRSAK